MAIPVIVAPAPPAFGSNLYAGAGGIWSTLTDNALILQSAGWSGYTMRNVIKTGAYAGGAPAVGTRIRITVNGGLTTGCSIGAAYVGHAGAGDEYDFDGGQVQILFAGSATTTVGASATKLSDETVFAFDKTKNLVVALYFDAASDVYDQELSASYLTYYKAAVNQAATTDVTGYSLNGITRNTGVPKIEVFG